ncbi:Ltp family lipoprotein [Microbacterium salsuginis]|uniref:Ltp family lipoprotein n=1 Tax=Microbacterium salsuginis TaxID=2722803 RepID=UPI0031B9AEFD
MTATDAAPNTAPVATATTAPPEKKKGLRWWAWVLIGLGALLLLIIVIGSINGARTSSVIDPDARPVATREAEDPSEAPEPEDTRVDTPNVVGGTVAEARAALEGVGLVFTTVDGTGDDWIVTSQTITVPAEPGTEVLVVAEAPKPVLTLAQQNAVEQGISYLDYSAFSRAGLISQLEYEGYTTDEATFAVDFIAPDWNAECAEQATSYLEYSSFSRDGLYSQLEYEGYTPEQIAFGLAAVGY